MKKIALSTILSIACLGFAFAQHTVEIKGKVKFINDNFKMTVYQRDGFNKNVLAETVVNPTDNTYKLNVTVKKPGVVIVDCGQWQDVSAWIEDENMEIDFRGLDTAKIKIKNPPYVYIKAGKKNEVMNTINYEAYRNYQNMIAIAQTTYNAPIEDNDKKQELSMKLYDMNQENFTAHMRYLAEHYADRTSILAAINCLNPEKDAALIENALSTLEKSNSGAMLVKDYREQKKIEAERRERMKEGNPLPEFSFPDAKGKMHSLKDFKGKVLVLDFWASWCGPCRQEVPNLKRIYEKYKTAKNVSFVSVSIDAKRPEWEKAVKEENMPWLQLLAPNAGKQIMELYQFSGIPFILVIDQEGNIYKKNLRGAKIEEAISDVLSGKKAQAPKSIGMSMMGASM